MFLFESDVVGWSERTPRHACAYGDVASLHRQVAAERVRAFTAGRADVQSGGFPNESEVGWIDPHELREFVARIDD